MKNILVAIDFDEYTGELTDFAASLAKPLEAKLWLIHIADSEPEFIGYFQGPQYIRDTFADELREEHKKLQAICAELENRGVNSEGLMIQGPTIDMILEEADKLNVDLIITASHRRSFIYRAFIGSVSTELLENSKIPLLAFPVGK